MKRILIAVALVLSAAVAVPAVAEQGKGKGKRPDVIALPKAGFQPEGITTWKKHTFFVGSRATGEIYKGSLRSGEGDTLVEGGGGKQATGLKVDRYGRLFVSGAAGKAIRVYDARSGDLIRTFAVPEANFINDVVITKRGAYFTESQVIPQLYFIPFGKKGELGELQRIPLTGDFVYGAGFNANGIEAAKGGKTLILISSNSGALYSADAATGATKRITTTSADPADNELANGDGLLLKGRRLYVVENRDDAPGPGVGVVSVVRLSRDLTSGFIARKITDADFDVPTTIARSGGRNYVVNGQFNSTSPTTDTYEVVKVPKK